MLKKTKEIKDYFNLRANSYHQAFDLNSGRNWLSVNEMAILRSQLKNKKELICLDLGVGIGRISSELLRKSSKVVGIDLSEKMLMEVRGKLVDKKLELRRHDLNKKLPLRGDQFDVAVCFRVIKYVREWKQLIKEVYRVLKSDGVFMVEVTNKHSSEFVTQTYMNYFALSLKEFEKVATECGFRIEAKHYQAKIPFFFYNLSNTRFKLRVIREIEKKLKLIFENRFSRSVIYTLIK